MTRQELEKEIQRYMSLLNLSRIEWSRELKCFRSDVMVVQDPSFRALHEFILTNTGFWPVDRPLICYS